MRSKAGELSLDLDVKDPELERMLHDAAAELEPVVAYCKGQKLTAEDPVFLVDGLIRLNGTNLVVGQPKVGKSSFMCGLIAALRDRKPEILNRKINHPAQTPPVLIFGTDQAEIDWLYFMRREKLVSQDKEILDPIEFFCPEAADGYYNFSEAGLDRMIDVVKRYQDPLVIIDSLSSMMGPLGLNENFNEFQAPLKRATKSLMVNGATVIILHHTKKKVESWDWIEEARGFGGISSLFSWGVLARYVSSLDPLFTRTDNRVGFVGKGRGSGTQGGAMGIYTDADGWVGLPGLEEAQRHDMLRAKEVALQGHNAKVFDQIVSFNRAGINPGAKQISEAVETHIKIVQRCCRILVRDGLIQFELRANGANPERLYWASSDPEAVVPSEASPRDIPLEPFVPFPKGTKGTNFSYFMEEEGNSQQPGKEQSSISKALQAIGYGQAVEIQLIDGCAWTNSYVTDGFNPNNGFVYVRRNDDCDEPRRSATRRCLPPNRVRPCQEKPSPDQDIEPLPF